MDEASSRLLLSGNEAVALGALHASACRGIGYPGTPSTEILEAFSALGGAAEWAPNEKVAAEVGLGVAFARARVLVTMKHVGMNVASDLLFTAAYSGISGGYVFACADDPGMASSQNEQDTRRYGVAAGVPVLEPADSQEAYDFTRLAFDVSERWGLPVILRLTTRVSHSYGVVTPRAPLARAVPAEYNTPREERVMIPAHARGAHRRLRAKLAEIALWNDREGPNVVFSGRGDTGIVTSGVASMHAREAAPGAPVLKLGMTHPLPLETVRRFADSVDDCIALEEGDPWLEESLLIARIRTRRVPEGFRFGEMTVEKAAAILEGANPAALSAPLPGKPPQLCQGCPHRATFEILRKLHCIVAGDIGCYTLGALPPIATLDIQICMGSSIGIGLGLRHALPEAEARRVVSVIGDSTFIHSGITGLVEMVYNPPPTGHVVLVLDNETTAMTGLQEHPGTGRSLDHRPAHRVWIESVARGVGLEHVHVLNPRKDAARLESLLREALQSNALSFFVVREPCLLALKARKEDDAAGAACGGGAGTPAPQE